MAHLSGEVEAESEEDDDDDDDCKKGSMDEVCMLSSKVLSTGNFQLGVLVEGQRLMLPSSGKMYLYILSSLCVCSYTGHSTQ